MRLTIAKTALALLSLSFAVPAVYAVTDTCYPFTESGSGYCNDTIRVYGDVYWANSVAGVARGWAIFDLGGLSNGNPTNYTTVKLHFRAYSPTNDPGVGLFYIPYSDPRQLTASALFDSLVEDSRYKIGEVDDVASQWYTITLPSWGNWPQGYPVSATTMVIAWISEDEVGGFIPVSCWAYGYNSGSNRPYLEFIE